MVRLDVVGYWTELKLEIVRRYALEYSRIMAKQTSPSLEHLYIDAFAGPGVHISRATGDYIPGSPTNALNIEPPFCQYHLIDMSSAKVGMLRDAVGEREGHDVFLYEGDCNEILLSEVFPKAAYGMYRRALCLLDPYNIDLDWQVIQTAGQMGSIEIFLNFMVMDINENVIRRNPDLIPPEGAARMNRFWGDESWRRAGYTKQGVLFDDMPRKTDNQTLAEAFRQRLVEVAGFKYVPPPLPMRNSKRAVIYYLFFASPNPIANRIVESIFNKYRDRGA